MKQFEKLKIQDDCRGFIVSPVRMYTGTMDYHYAATSKDIFVLVSYSCRCENYVTGFTVMWLTPILKLGFVLRPSLRNVSVTMDVAWPLQPTMYIM
jgi:hypothetical protein